MIGLLYGYLALAAFLFVVGFVGCLRSPKDPIGLDPPAWFWIPWLFVLCLCWPYPLVAVIYAKCRGWL